MKVSELIYELAKFPKDMNVKVVVGKRVMNDFLVTKCFYEGTNIASAVILTKIED